MKTTRTSLKEDWSQNCPLISLYSRYEETKDNKMAIHILADLGWDDPQLRRLPIRLLIQLIELINEQDSQMR